VIGALDEVGDRAGFAPAPGGISVPDRGRRPMSVCRKGYLPQRVPEHDAAVANLNVGA